jgi:acyl-coenzyme A thioesterase PaaI-like protein
MVQGERDALEEKLVADGWTFERHEGFIALIGGLWRRSHGNGFDYGFVGGSEHGNRSGFVQGGMLMTIADRAFGMTARAASGAAKSATVSFSAQFMKSMDIGTFAFVRPKVVRLTHSLAFMAGDIFCKDEIIFSAQGVWRIVRAA